MKHTHFSTHIAIASIVFALGFAGIGAAENTPDKEQQPDLKALLQKIEALEKRVHDLEGQLTERAIPLNRFGPLPTPNGPNGLNGPIDPNMDDVIAQMRELMRNNGIDNFGGPQNAPLLKRGLNRKPRLGVELDQVSPELTARFKNEVKSGAFVMMIVPGSPAEKAGIQVGDAIVSFDGKAVEDPKAVIEAVKNSAPGSREIGVSRRGEQLALKVTLNAEQNLNPLNAIEPPVGLDNEGWLRQDGAGVGGNVQTQTELKVSALELNDKLAKQLKLNDEQKIKAKEILAKHQKSLSDEFQRSGGMQKKAKGNALNFTLNGNLTELAKKHADAAATDLANVFNADQLKQWNAHRQANNSVSFSQSITNNGPALNAEKDDAGDAKF